MRYLFMLLLAVVFFMAPSVVVAHQKNTKKHSAKKQVVKKPVVKKALELNEQPEDITPYLVSNIYIKVLLHEQSSIPLDNLFIDSPEGFVLENPIQNGTKGVWKAERINLAVKDNVLYVQCKDNQFRRVKHNNLIVSPTKDIIHLNKKSYHGKLNIRIDKSQQKLLIINRLNLDDYIYSVLRNEMLSYWPLEVQKVQAVASRTYALHHMRHIRSRTPNSLYDIKNTNIHQVYGGSHECKHLRKAVNETHNLILTYNNNIALTMFDICCGGVVPEKMAIRDDDKPYLFRSNQCTYCKDSSSYIWKSSYRTDDILSALQQYSCKPRECAKMGKIMDVVITSKDRAGIAKKIAFIGSKKKVEFTIKDFKRCLSCASLDVPKSYSFTAEKDGGKIKLVGRGYGHNIGLCQVGARELVRRGWDYKEILAFYYPETNLARLKCD